MCVCVFFACVAHSFVSGELQRHVSMQFEIRRVEENHKLTDSKSDDTGSQLQVIIPRDLESQAHLHLYVSQGTGNYEKSCCT